MDETFFTKGIILNRHTFKESDSKVAVFCLDKGKLDLVARGTKKPSSKLAGHIEPMCLSRIMVIKGKNFNYIGAAVNQEAFGRIREDLNKYILAGRILGLMDKHVQIGLPDDNLFALLYGFLHNLDNTGIDMDPTLWEVAFKLKFLRLLGLMPDSFASIDDWNSLTLDEKSFKVFKSVLASDFSSLNTLKIDKKDIKNINSFFNYQTN